MLRSRINKAINDAKGCFKANGWALPPSPRWDVTDFGLGTFEKYGLVLVNLCEEPEYCEKLMYAAYGQTTPAHTHKIKKEDIICRYGSLAIKLWNKDLETDESNQDIIVKVNCREINIKSGSLITLNAGERITIRPGIYHEFYPLSEECIIGEVSTVNNDLNDNFFVDPEIGRFSNIVEDEGAEVKLVSDL